MGIDQIAPEALRLSVRDRALLAATLWESIGDPNMLPAERSDDEAWAWQQLVKKSLNPAQCRLFPMPS